MKPSRTNLKAPHHLNNCEKQNNEVPKEKGKESWVLFFVFIS